MPPLIEYLEIQVKNLMAGQISKHFSDWEDLTSDKEILSIVTGVTIDFNPYKPLQITSISHPLSKLESEIVQIEIKKLLEKRVLVISEHEQGEILSPVFLRAKPHGSHWLILNRKKPNEHMEKLHYKMETIYTVINPITPNCFMASVDLKDAYFSVKIREEHQKFLKCTFNDIRYTFTALPNGLSTGPRKLTTLKTTFSLVKKERPYLICIH